MSKQDLTRARENRIIDEILVDAHGSEEQAMAWYYYLDAKLQFPFLAKCTKPRSISPLERGEEAQVVGMAKTREAVDDW